jgi:glycosyltransferase involved in cell wall biosynthesis
MDSEPGRAGAISCVMPVFNGARYVEAAIASLVGQSLRPNEIIVIDDGSTDDSADRAVAAGNGLVRLVRQVNSGANAARDMGLSRATGDFVFYLDADDVCPEGALKALHDALQAHPEWDGVFGKWRNFWIEELAAEEASEAAAHLHGEKTDILLNSGLLRTSLLRRLPPMATPEHWHTPILWLAEVQRTGAAFGRIEPLVLHRRIHHNNMSRQKSSDSLANLALRLHRAARSSRQRGREDGSSGGKG